MDYTPEQLARIAKFQWQDDADLDGAINHPGYEFEKQTQDCSQSITDYVFLNISSEYYESEVFSIVIPSDVHPLVSDRYDKKWTTESRDAIFEIIRSSCLLITESAEYKSKISQTINSKIFQGRNTEVDWIMLYDDPPCDDDVGQMTIEIGIKDVVLLEP